VPLDELDDGDWLCNKKKGYSSGMRTWVGCLLIDENIKAVVKLGSAGDDYFTLVRLGTDSSSYQKRYLSTLRI
jgi:hypothetical protein